jgi:hypothetical protein
MTFWLEEQWQAKAAMEIQSALQSAHLRLINEKRGNADWTIGVLQALVPAARSLCGDQGVCGLKCHDDLCKGECCTTSPVGWKATAWGKAF